jgi:PleD family two-component response regulator
LQHPGLRREAFAKLAPTPWERPLLPNRAMTQYSSPPRTRILLAVTPEKVDRLRRVLTEHDPVFVNSSYEAMSLLMNDGFGLVIIGVHFDESQMFTLLSDIRAHAKYRQVPVLCVLGARGRALSPVAIEGLDHAVKAMTANGFLDLQRYPDDEEHNARIRRIVDFLILLDGELQAPSEKVETEFPVMKLMDRRKATA